MLEKEGLQRFPETWWCCCLLRPSCIFHSFHYFVSHHSHCFWKNHSGSTTMFFGHFERKEKKRCRASFVSNGCCQTKKELAVFLRKVLTGKWPFAKCWRKKKRKGGGEGACFYRSLGVTRHFPDSFNDDEANFSIENEKKMSLKVKFKKTWPRKKICPPSRKQQTRIFFGLLLFFKREAKDCWKFDFFVASFFCSRAVKLFLLFRFLWMRQN